MKRKVLDFTLNQVLFLFLLPLFFVFHGFVEYYFLVAPFDVATLFFVYVISSLMLAFASWLIFRSWQKAVLFAFLLMGLNFFFGSLHDGLKMLFGDHFF